jgi:branched-chain amino acid transport system ATP-binding protein
MLLEEGIAVSYGLSQVLFNVSVKIGRGEAVTLLGRNGMGKTTTVSTIMGICRSRRGSIRFNSRRVDGLEPFEVCAAGIALVPEGRRIFPNLTVRENLLMAYRERATGSGSWTFDRVLAFLPRLRERLSNGGSQLSGASSRCWPSEGRS